MATKTPIDQLSSGLQRLAHSLDAFQAASQKKEALARISEGQHVYGFRPKWQSVADEQAWVVEFEAARDVVDQAERAISEAFASLTADEIAEVRRFRRGMGEWRQFGVA